MLRAAAGSSSSVLTTSTRFTRLTNTRKLITYSNRPRTNLIIDDDDDDINSNDKLISTNREDEDDNVNVNLPNVNAHTTTTISTTTTKTTAADSVFDRNTTNTQKNHSAIRQSSRDVNTEARSLLLRRAVYSQLTSQQQQPSENSIKTLGTNEAPPRTKGRNDSHYSKKINISSANNTTSSRPTTTTTRPIRTTVNRTQLFNVSAATTTATKTTKSTTTRKLSTLLPTFTTGIVKTTTSILETRRLDDDVSQDEPISSYKLNDLYERYKPEVGLRTALILGSMLCLIVVYLLWKNRCRCILRGAGGSSSSDDYDMEYWLNHVDKQKGMSYL